MAHGMTHTSDDEQQSPGWMQASDRTAQAKDAGVGVVFGPGARHEDQGQVARSVPGLILAQMTESAVIGKRYVRKGQSAHGMEIA
jgi:hypothetical protein